MKKLNWHTEKRRVDKLLPRENNPRTINQKQMSDLKKSIEKFNLVEIPAIDIDGTILAGHQRLKALQLLGRGDEYIDVRIPNRKLTESERDRYMLGSNALGGSWNFEKLKDFSPELLTDIGFEDLDIAHIWDKGTEVENDHFDEEKELGKITEAKTQTGDLILLGRHKLICGDSTRKEVLEQLFEGEKTSMIYSDPPYNINLSYEKGVGGKQNYGAEVHDDRTNKEYRSFIQQTMGAALAVAEKNLHIFYWCDQSYIWLMQTLYQEIEIDNKRVCLWIKNGHNPTPGVAFNKAYEPCVYGVRGKPFLTSKKNITELLNKDIRNGNDALDDVWTAKRLGAKEYSHATSKPPSLHQKAILRCTKPNDIILDSFGGSGSTLIAAEQLNRRVYCVEQEPRFCDLIIARFEKLTGITAEVIRQDER